MAVKVKKGDNVLKDLFGTAKTKKSTEELLKEVRAGSEGKWL